MLHLGALRDRIVFLSYKSKTDLQANLRASTPTSTPGKNRHAGRGWSKPRGWSFTIERIRRR